MANAKTDLSRFDNSWYNPGNFVKRFVWYYMNLFFLSNKYFPFNSLKILILRLFGAKVGKGVIIKPGVNVKYPWKLSVGDHVWIGENAWIDNLSEVTIADNACLSQGAMLMCGNHNYKKVTFNLITEKIKLEEGVWIGANSIVCPGVICRSHSMLTVNSVAVTSLESYTIYQGNPAKVLRKRTIRE